jgi:hypothetical protein
MKTLDEILQEHRSGRREKSVLSQAIFDKQPISTDKLLNNISMDLED